MGAMASQITSLTIIYSTVYSGADQRKPQSSVSQAFVRGIHRSTVNSPHKGPVTRKVFPFDDVIMRRNMVLRLLSNINQAKRHTFKLLMVDQSYIYETSFKTSCRTPCYMQTRSIIIACFIHIRGVSHVRYKQLVGTFFIMLSICSRGVKDICVSYLYTD